MFGMPKYFYETCLNLLKAMDGDKDALKKFEDSIKEFEKLNPTSEEPSNE